VDADTGVVLYEGRFRVGAVVVIGL